MSKNNYNITNKSSSAELTFSEKLSEAKIKEIHNENQLYAAKLPSRPSMFDLYAATEIAKSNRKNKRKNSDYEKEFLN